MAVTSALSPVSLSSYFDDATGAVKHANLYFYAAGTLDAITVYTDSLLTVAHAMPVMTTGNGRVPPVFIGVMEAPGPTAYRVRAFDQYSQLIEDIDNLPGAVEPTTGGEPPVTPTDAMLKTGDVIAAFDNAHARSGFVRCNGGTIGPALSDATEMKSDLSKPLFLHLWTQDTSFNLVVALPGGTPSRGASALGDWDLNKTITVPDLKGRAMVGISAMGSASSTNRLAGAPVTSTSGDARHVGAHGGLATHTLLAAEIAKHTHTATQTTHVHANAKAALHNHTGSVTIASTGAQHQHYNDFTSGSENTTHVHSVPSGGGSTTAGPGIAGTFATMAGVNTGGQNTNHQHAVQGWTRVGDGDHGHTGSSISINNNATQPVVTMDTIAPAITVNSTTVGDGAHNNTQPFYSMCFYMKV